jgi:hypothetical protein
MNKKDRHDGKNGKYEAKMDAVMAEAKSLSALDW